MHRSIDAKLSKPDSVWKASAVLLDGEAPSSDYYLNCLRPDTQRNDADFLKSFAGLGEDWDTRKEEVDRLEPPISNLPAPDR